MNFYIRQIKLWFKKNVEPKIYEFEPNKINVITGDSSTGKSSILRIIDYCLLSEHPAIVEDVINQNIKWYGLAFTLNGVDYALARKNPHDETPAHEVFFEEMRDFPNEIQANTNQGELVLKLNNLFGIPRATFKMERKKEEVILNFRHFLIFSYLTEDIIATMNTYFDTRFFGSSEYDYFLDDFLKIALGMEDAKHDALKRLLEGLKKKLDAEYKKRQAFEKKKNSYERKLIALKNKFVSLGLGEDSFFSDVDTMLGIIKNGLRKYELYSDNVKLLRDLDALNNKKRELSAEFNSLKREYKRYQDLANSQCDSLIPIEFLKKHLDEVLDYEDTKLLVDSLEESLVKIKRIKNQKIKLPENFEKY